MWEEPKTDWVATDYVNIVDYNRIINNILHIYDMAEALFKSIERPILGDLATYTTIPYASNYNALESAIYALNSATYNLDHIGERKIYYANQSLPDYNDYNRIENAIYYLYLSLKAHKESLIRLPFTLGNMKGVKA